MAGVALAVVGLWLTRRGRLFPYRWQYRLVVAALPAALLANIFGWLLTEMGRQPWTVVGELLTANSVSPGVSLTEVAISLSAFTLVYAVLAVVELRLLVKYVKAGTATVMPYPEDAPEPERTDERVPAFVY
jgi:cytochrome d ubiquinol oxidase subunit I